MNRHGVGGYRAKPSGDNPHDFFPTPTEVTRAILHALQLPGGKWCEPCVGDGAIVRAAQRFADVGLAPYESWATFDVRPVPTVPGVRGYHVPGVDFLSLPVPPKEFDVVITNPPFYLAE